MASESDIQRLKQISPPTIVAQYSDEDLGAMIDDQGTVRLAAGLLWEERAVETSELVDITEGSSSRKMQQEFDNAVKMTERYLGSLEDGTPGRRPARVHHITRE